MHRNNNRFDLNTLVIFRRVVDLNSLSKAAEELGINASTVSRKISEIEAYYGVKLLIRSTRALDLTEEGKALYRYCQNVDDVLRRSEDEIMLHQLEPTGILKVVVPVDLGNLLLQDALVSFSRKYPKVLLDLDFSNRQVDMLEEGIDIWFCIGEVSNKSLISSELLSYKRYLMASKTYLSEYGDISSIADLKAPHRQLKSKNPFIYQESDKSVLKQLPVALTVNSGYTIFKACASGLGLAFIMPNLVEKYDTDKTLVPILPNEIYQQSSVNMVYKERKLKPMRVEYFLAHMKSYFL